jgi:methyl-accepting chemotaxis protein
MKSSVKPRSSFSIRLKLILISLLIIIPSFLIMGYHEMKTVTITFQGEALEKARSDLLMGYELINRIYPGAWTVKDGQLLKGSQLMNDNTDIVDLIGKLTNGDTVTVFMGDTRITTNVINEGKRAVGTKASVPVIDKVLKAGEFYVGTANVVGHTYQAAYMPIKDDTGTVIGMWYVGAPDSNERIQGLIQEKSYELFLIALIIVAVAVLLNFILFRPIVRRIETASTTLQQVANKDLTVKELKVTSQDESGKLMQSVNEMVQHLRVILQQVNDATIQLAASSEELYAGAEQSSLAAVHIASAAQSGAAGAEKQLGSVSEAASAINQFSASIRLIAASSDEVATLADHAYRASNDGVVAVADLLTQMNAINSNVQETSGFIRNLGDRSQAIGTIVSIITAIANQTNLLALNAAIEAARAGEMGKGFAVVASEVRKLSEQSGESAQQITQLIEEIQIEMEHAVSSIQQGTDKMADGMNKTLLANEAFNAIQYSVSNVSTKVQEVASGIGQMSSGSLLIVKAIDTINQSAEESASTSQETSAASEQQLAALEEITASSRSLTLLAEQLHQALSTFKLK